MGSVLSDLSDSILLARILAPGMELSRSMPIAREVLRHVGGVVGLADISSAELQKVEGIGEARAGAIIAAVEMGRRTLGRRVKGGRLSSSVEVHGLFGPMLIGERCEVFCCALVDAKLRLTGMELISRGTLDASIVHPREAFRAAVRSAASGVIFAHNHPSGDPEPSGEDIRVTERLSRVGGILGIPLLDHVIVGAGDTYYSFADAGMLKHDNGYRGMVVKQRSREESWRG